MQSVSDPFSQSQVMYLPSLTFSKTLSQVLLPSCLRFIHRHHHETKWTSRMKWRQDIPLSWSAQCTRTGLCSHRTNTCKSNVTFVPSYLRNKFLTALTALGIICWVPPILRKRRVRGHDCASGIGNLDNAFLRICSHS